MAFDALLHSVTLNGKDQLVVQGSTTSAIIDGAMVSLDGGQTFQPYEYLGQGTNSNTQDTGEFIRVDGQIYAYNSEDPTASLKTGNWRITEEDLDPDQPPCFVAGTMIRTPNGEVPIEELNVGDHVQTLSGGCAPILWHGQSTVSPGMQRRAPALRAIHIGRGAIGNDRPLEVSQQHRILIQGYKAELWFGEPEVLVPAKALLRFDRVSFCRSDTEISYHHILLSGHQVVFSNGIPSESLFLGEQLSAGYVDEIETLFPELWQKRKYHKAAKPIVRFREAQVLFSH